MKLYVANTTSQHWDFNFRLPEIGRQVTRKVGPGRQEIIHDGSSADVTAIIDHLKIFGVVDAKDVPRTAAFVGACYSVDKPIDVDRLKTAVAHNAVVLEERGLEIRKAAAVGINHQLEEAGTGITHLEVEIEEVAKPGQDAAKPLEVIEVARQGQQPRGPGGRNSRGRRAA